jgi:hypothetical protein
MKVAVELAVKAHTVSADTCVSSRLEAPVATLPGKVGEWTQPEGSKVAYRLLHAPKADLLPPEAFAVVPEALRASSCRHRLQFNPPQFLEVNEAGRVSTVAFVGFSDLCPLCGAGYQVTLVKTGGQWKPDPPRIVTTWIS